MFKINIFQHYYIIKLKKVFKVQLLNKVNDTFLWVNKAFL